MPNHDGTGPFGDGRPGRGFGPCGRYRRRFCAGFRRMGGGLGLRSRGFRFRGQGVFPKDIPQNAKMTETGFYPYTQEELRTQKTELEAQLKWLNEQLETGKED